eukprot:UN09239
MKKVIPEEYVSRYQMWESNVYLMTIRLTEADR